MNQDAEKLMQAMKRRQERAWTHEVTAVGAVDSWSSEASERARELLAARIAKALDGGHHRTMLLP